MESSSETNKLKLYIPNLPMFPNDNSVSVSLDYLRAFLVDNKFKVKHIEYVAIDWQVNWDRNARDPTDSLKRVPFLVVHVNHPSHR